MIVPEITDQGENDLRKRFIAENQKNFDDFTSGILARDKIASNFRTMNYWVLDRKIVVATLQEENLKYADFDPVLSIFKYIQSNGVLSYKSAVNAFAVHILQKQYGGEVLKLAMEELAALEKSFDYFKKENQKVLLELGLIEPAA